MNQVSPVVIWLNCYGGWDPKMRHPLETAGYHLYLDGIVQCLEPLQKRIQAVYLSGGMRDRFGRTECETTGVELHRRMQARGMDREIIYDEESVTTAGVVRKWVDTVSEKYPESSTILICDSARETINRNLAEYVAKKKKLDPAQWRWSILALPRPDITEQSTAAYQAEKWERMQAEGIEIFDEKERVERLYKNKPY